jgi:hypothetical protein
MRTDAAWKSRVDFSKKMLEMIAAHQISVNNILWTDEASFYLFDVISVSNVYFWCLQNPSVTFQKPLASPKITGVGSITDFSCRLISMIYTLLVSIILI